MANIIKSLFHTSYSRRIEKVSTLVRTTDLASALRSTDVGLGAEMPQNNTLPACSFIALGPFLVRATRECRV